MKKLIYLAILFFSVGSSYAQNKLSKEVIQKDSVIKVDIIDPAVQEAQGEAPDWAALTAEITQKYDATFADRTVTKGIIYYSWGKDWPTFTAAIVKYTNKYEDPDDLVVLNYNANFILKYSSNPSEIATALSWSKHTVDKAPANEEYKKTYAALSAKKSGQN